MIHKDNLVFPTYDRFLSMKISADKNNTTYRQYSLEMDPLVGEPDVMWQSVVYILDEQMVWTNGQMMQRTVYIDKPVTDTSAFIAIQSAFGGNEDVQAINGAYRGTFTMQYDDQKFGYAKIKNVSTSNAIAKIENLTNKSFDLYINGAREDFNILLNIIVEHDGFECQVIKIVNVKYVKTIVPLIFMNTSSLDASFVIEMVGSGLFYKAIVNDFDGNIYDYDFSNVNFAKDGLADAQKTISLAPGESFMIYSTLEDYTPSNNNYIHFKITNNDLRIEGDVLAMCGGEMANYACYSMFADCTALTRMPTIWHNDALYQYCFAYMFSGCTALTDISDITAVEFKAYCCYLMFQKCNGLTDISSHTVGGEKFTGLHCCENMFYQCVNITKAPQLPTLVLYSYCYRQMFYGCTALVEAPALPAETLPTYCYELMFYNCGIVDAPLLPAKSFGTYCCHSMFTLCQSLEYVPDFGEGATMGDYCCYDMFRRCTSLVTAPNLLSTSLGSHCYTSIFGECTSLVNVQEKLPSTTLKTYCYQYMFDGCTSLTKAPELPALTLQTYCYQYMFRNCTSLTEAPVLPALTLTSYCYSSMFYGCKLLNFVKAMFTTTPSGTTTGNWLYGVSSTGTFVKNSAATWTTTGASGVPTGWSVEYADE